jgi:hypothetical protein
MSDSKNITAWLLLVLLAVAGGGFAVLGIVQSHVPLDQAVSNTTSADGYTEVFSQNTAQGKETEHLVYQAPDRLGGYDVSGNKRTYVVIIGTKAYESLTVAANAPTSHLTFYEQTVPGAKGFDPTQLYLPYAKQATNVKSNGGTYAFTLTQMGQVGAFVYEVSGWHVSHMTLAVPAAKASVHLAISQVGTSPPVGLPPGAKVVAGSPSSASGGAG